jgi:peptide methionine sulfoxide reductase msrA/msrB
MKPMPRLGNEKKIRRKTIVVCLGIIGLLTLSGCARTNTAHEDKAPEAKEATSMTEIGFDGTYRKQAGIDVIYLAGGCFWGMEKLVQSLPGVVDATSGYANGTVSGKPTYELVCSGGTGFKETVRVEYDPSHITLAQILQAYFLVIDPTVENRQGNDKGNQYQTGIYYADEASKTTVEEVVAVEASRYETFATEHGPLVNFYDAEEYHQDYLEKNPGGYCHIPKHEIADVVALITAEESYEKPTQETLKATLTEEQYDVTQNAATERPFSNAYWNTKEEGIYVDVTTGQPLFRSADKYESRCGWPSFTTPIYEGVVHYRKDTSYGMERTEVISSVGEAHLGHVFEGDPDSPNGIRYCMNSASLRFIPKAQMEEEGYGPYLMLLERK